MWINTGRAFGAAIITLGSIGVGALPSMAADEEPGEEAGGRVVAAAIAGLSFSPTSPELGGAITVTGTGCDPGEDVLITTLMTAIGGSTYRNVIAPAAADGSFAILTRVHGAPGDVPVVAGGDQFRVDAHCGGAVTSDPDRSQTVFGFLAIPAGAPEAVQDTASTPKNTPVTIDVLANDRGDGLRVIGTRAGSHGDVSIAPDGLRVIYTPDPGYDGSDVLEYTIEDSSGRAANALVLLTVTSSPPVAVDDSFATPVDTPLSVALGDGLLANDTDPDGDVMRVCLATSTHPSHGTLTYPSNDGRFDYAPDAGFTGVDTFTYHAGDRTDCGNFATVTITVGDPSEPGPGDPDPGEDSGDEDGTTDPGESEDTDTVLPDTGAGTSTSWLALTGLLLVGMGGAVIRRGRTRS